MSMPCLGSLHFYKEFLELHTISSSVSMPCLGLTPFLRYGVQTDRGYHGGVNALSRAHSVSTRYNDPYIVSFTGCVNALSRAHSISTK